MQGVTTVGLDLAKKEGQVGTRYGLRRVFEQERRPFMLAIKELRPPAAACARSDRRQSREVRAVGRGRAQCDGLSEDASVRPRVSHVWGGERVLLSGGMSCVGVRRLYALSCGKTDVF